jgi:hypothetical protein
MSIINDALKKVQQNFEKHKKALSEAPVDEIPRPKEKFSKLSQAIIMASFAGSILFLVAFVIFSPKQKKIELPPAAATSTPAANVATQVSPVIPPAPKPPAEKLYSSKTRIGGFTLNGIVSMDGGYVALINNKIVKEGESIGSRRIIGISKEEVKVFDNGETIILRMNKF